MAWDLVDLATSGVEGLEAYELVSLVNGARS